MNTLKAPENSTGHAVMSEQYNPHYLQSNIGATNRVVDCCFVFFFFFLFPSSALCLFLFFSPLLFFDDKKEQSANDVGEAESDQPIERDV